MENEVIQELGEVWILVHWNRNLDYFCCTYIVPANAEAPVS